MIRAATLQDAPFIADLFYQSMPSPWKTADIEDALRSPSMVVWLLEEEGKIMSALLMQICMDEAEILSVATDPGARRKGYARSLIQYALREIGYEVSIFLEVRSKNSGAISFYESLGFYTIGMRKGYYTSPRDDALLMKFGKN